MRDLAAGKIQPENAKALAVLAQSANENLVTELDAMKQLIEMGYAPKTAPTMLGIELTRLAAPITVAAEDV